MTTEYLHPLIKDYRKRGRKTIFSRLEVKRLKKTQGLEDLTLQDVKDLDVLLSAKFSARVTPEVYQTIVSRLWESGAVWKGVIQENNVIEEGYRILRLSYCDAHFPITLEIKQA